MNKPKNFKQQAHELVDRLPDTATWPDLIDYAAERQDLEIAQFYSEYESTYPVEAQEGQVAEGSLMDYDPALYRHLERDGGPSSES